MPAVTSQPKTNKRISTVVWLLLIAVSVLMIAAISIPNLLRSRTAADSAMHYGARGAVAEQTETQTSAVRAEARQVIRTAEMSLLVDDPAKRMEEVSGLVSRLGGFVESSQVWRVNNGGAAQMTLRVPEVALEEAKLELRRAAKKVENEKTNATDVTSQMVDMDATLRNYRAEEQQYLAIMQRAGNVNDTLAVVQRLSDVRGRIERTEAQLKLMSRQVEMATITVSLRAESITAIQWMPNFREAWRDAAESMASYLAAMTALILYVPVVLAWFFTVVVLLALAWRTLRWLWTRWFVAAQEARA